MLNVLILSIGLGIVFHICGETSTKYVSLYSDPGCTSEHESDSCCKEEAAPVAEHSCCSDLPEEIICEKESDCCYVHIQYIKLQSEIFLNHSQINLCEVRLTTDYSLPAIDKSPQKFKAEKAVKPDFEPPPFKFLKYFSITYFNSYDNSDLPNA